MGKLTTITNIIRAYQNWWTWFLLYYNILKGDKYILRTRSGEKFIIRTKNQDIHRIGEIYHLDTYARLPINPSDTVIDIGAHCGFFSLYAAKRAKRVLSFEPVAETFAAFKRNIKLNRVANITAINKGVSSKRGKARIYLSDDASTNSLLKETDKYEIIELITLKDVFEENSIRMCDYLKIDCEGAEFDMIMRCPKKYLSRIKKIAMEYHDGPEFRKNKQPRLKKLIFFLNKNGFKVRICPNPEEKQLGMLYAYRR